MKEKILITSATGKTGFEATKKLLEDGYTVRVLVRSRNTKANTLETLGAEICVGDITNYQDLTKALEGIDCAYYCHPFIPELIENVETFIYVAKQCNLKLVVNMGQWLAEFENQKSIHTVETQMAYSLFEKSGLNVIHLIPGFFADNTFFVTEFAIHLGLMPLPFGSGKNPAISNKDLGLTIAALLKNPTPYIGKRIRPTGPVSLSAKEMAKIFSKVVGRKVRYINIPEWMFLKAAFMFAKEFGLNKFSISQIRHYMNEYQLNRFDIGGATTVVKELTGKEPDNFETIVRSYVDKAPFKERNFSNWLSALKKFMVLPMTPIPSIKELEKYNQ